MKFNQDQVIFIHIPRTAGTYIERQLCDKYQIKQNWPRANIENLFGLYKVRQGNYLTLQHLTLTEMIKFGFLKPNVNNQYIFTVVRHPYDRVLSLYKNWFKKYKTLDIFLNVLEKLKIDDYQFNGITTKNSGFNYLNMTHNLQDIKYFVIPQYYYIKNLEESDQAKYNVNVIKYDEMETLNTNLGLNLKFKYSAMPGKRDVLTPSQKGKIAKLYQIDFIEFGFQS